MNEIITPLQQAIADRKIQIPAFLIAIVAWAIFIQSAYTQQTFDKVTPIYIDSNLKDGVKGEEASKRIHAIGFTEIYITTGYERDHFPPMDWIVKVTGKEPPF